MIKSIFHAHNWQFQRLKAELQDLRDTGFDAVQISPAQKSPAGDAWYLRYQPYDHLAIEGLGTRADLEQLCVQAQQFGLTVVADLVFNHMAIPPGATRAAWTEAIRKKDAGDPSALHALVDKLNHFPHLTADDFQPWRDMQGADWDNENRYEAWGNGEWPELKPTPRVLDIHKQHIRLLYDCGVRGFRFDAVKHMRADHLQHYVDFIRALGKSIFVYGEVFSHRPEMHQEYERLFPTTDFGFVAHLRSKLLASHQFEFDPGVAFLSESSIRFGTNHDLRFNPPELVGGLLFQSDKETRLANALAIVMKGGTSLVLADDIVNDELLKACVALRAAEGGLAGKVKVSEFAEGWELRASGAALRLDFSRGTLARF